MGINQFLKSFEFPESYTSKKLKLFKIQKKVQNQSTLLTNGYIIYFWHAMYNFHTRVCVFHTLRVEQSTRMRIRSTSKFTNPTVLRVEWTRQFFLCGVPLIFS
jgi:hypothetical protein